MRELFERVQAASRSLAMVSDSLVNSVLEEIADELKERPISFLFPMGGYGQRDQRKKRKDNSLEDICLYWYLFLIKRKETK